MKVTNRTKRKLSTLPYGTVFMFEGEYYMKIEKITLKRMGVFNAVNIQTGYLESINTELHVLELNCEVVINGIS